ncbi:MAG TPA: bifunctional diguanylate cyclase/phosphodiesterase [Caulobacteraceae bacterium]|nr:bifunctional diguanylate cyclase/phosphodiesterase [Caulobacteraceae bacterium]
MQRLLPRLLGLIPLVPGFALAAAPAKNVAPIMMPAASPETLIAFSVTASVAAIAFGGLALLSMMRSQRASRTVSAISGAIEKLELGEQPELDAKAGGKAGRVAESFNAMAQTVVERERHIRHAALHDAATDLPNRASLEWRLGELEKKRTTGVRIAAVSLDRLKGLRLAIGYEPADSLVAEVAARLSTVMPKWPIGRISTEALGIVFRAPDDEAARRVGKAIVEALKTPVSVCGATIDMDVTVGLSALGEGEAAPKASLEHALIAIDQALAAHRRIQIFDPKAYGDPAATLALMGEMAQAMASGEIILHLQPRHDMRKGVTSGVEALIRWKHPRLGLLSPNQFVDVAEQTGHIRPMTEWVLRQAIEQQTALKAAGYDLEMSINVPGRLLSDPQFIEVAITLAAKATGRLCFDVTESAVMDNPPVALATIERFSDAGIGISIDDYGAGMSYLAHLKQIRADELKIDKAFVLNVAEAQKDALVVRTTINLAHSLGMKVTAEGVETDSAYALLASMGCDIAQGFLIARPMPYDELLRFLREERGSARRYG